MTAAAQRFFELHTQHYAHFDDVIHAAVALRDVMDVLGRQQQVDILTVLFPGIADIHGLWAEIDELLGQYDGIDGIQAVSDLQERGQRPASPGDAIAQRLSEIGKDIHFTVRQHRLASAEASAAISGRAA